MITGYSYRQRLHLQGSSGAGTNYQKDLKIGESSGSSNYDFHLNGHCKDFPNDIRFESIDGVELSYWVEKVIGSAPNRTAYVWVKVKDNLDYNVDIYCYYGKEGEVSGADGLNTFIHFDDFDDAQLNTDIWHWIRESPGNWDEGISRPGWLRITVENKDLYQDNNTAPLLCGNSPRSVNENFEIRCKLDISPNVVQQQAGIIVYGDDDNHIRFTRGYIDYAQRLQFAKEINRSFTHLDLSFNPNLVWLRIRKIVDNYTVYYSTDGINYVNWYTYSASLPSQLYPVLSAFGSPTPVNAYFDYIFVRKVTSAEPVFLSSDGEEPLTVVLQTISCSLESLVVCENKVQGSAGVEQILLASYYVHGFYIGLVDLNAQLESLASCIEAGQLVVKLELEGQKSVEFVYSGLVTADVSLEGFYEKLFIYEGLIEVEQTLLSDYRISGVVIGNLGQELIVEAGYISENVYVGQVNVNLSLESLYGFYVYVGQVDVNLDLESSYRFESVYVGLLEIGANLESSYLVGYVGLLEASLVPESYYVVVYKYEGLVDSKCVLESSYAVAIEGRVVVSCDLEGLYVNESVYLGSSVVEGIAESLYTGDFVYSGLIGLDIVLESSYAGIFKEYGLLVFEIEIPALVGLGYKGLTLGRLYLMALYSADLYEVIYLESLVKEKLELVSLVR